jgi:hypothetical protein
VTFRGIAEWHTFGSDDHESQLEPRAVRGTSCCIGLSNAIDFVPR